MVREWWRITSERTTSTLARRWAELTAASSAVLGAQITHRTGDAAITEERIAALAAILENSQRYVQRVVEEMEFVPTGGHRWTRTMQVELPSASAATKDWYVISLGSFARRRFPDMEVTDATGRRINLVTREEHGEFLTRAIIAPLIRDYVAQVDSPAEEQIEALGALTNSVNCIVTDLRRDAASTVSDEIRAAVAAYRRLTGLAPDSKQVHVMQRVLTEASEVTRYLCWVRARPEEVVSLRVTYTSSDAWGSTSGDDGFIRWMRDQWSGCRSACRSAYQSVRQRQPRGWLEPRRPSFPEPLVPEVERMRLYRLLGLAPINYEFPVPGHGDAGSYYFALQPPPKTTVMRVIGTGITSTSDTEIDCARKSVHSHNGSAVAVSDRDGFDGERSQTIHAYLKPTLHEHKTLIGGALINLLFVCFVARGRFVTGMGLTTQAWLLLTPTILTGFIAQRQRHYYALVTHLQRGMLWGYLLISVGFLITVAFSTAYRDGEWGAKALIVFVVFAIASAGTAVFYLPQGHRYRRSLTAKMRGMEFSSVEEEQEKYDELVQKYCDDTLKLTLSAMLAVAVAAAVIIAGGWVKAGKPPASGSAIEVTAPRIELNVR